MEGQNGCVVEGVDEVAVIVKQGELASDRPRVLARQDAERLAIQCPAKKTLP